MTDTVENQILSDGAQALFGYYRHRVGYSGNTVDTRAISDLKSAVSQSIRYSIYSFINNGALYSLLRAPELEGYAERAVKSYVDEILKDNWHGEYTFATLLRALEECGTDELKKTVTPYIKNAVDEYDCDNSDQGILICAIANGYPEWKAQISDELFDQSLALKNVRHIRIDTAQEIINYLDGDKDRLARFHHAIKDTWKSDLVITKDFCVQFSKLGGLSYSVNSNGKERLSLQEYKKEMDEISVNPIHEMFIHDPQGMFTKESFNEAVLIVEAMSRMDDRPDIQKRAKSELQSIGFDWKTFNFD